MKQLLYVISSSIFIQKILNWVVSASHAMMGIGSTGSLNSETDMKILKKIIQKYPDEKLMIFDVGANIGQFTTMSTNTLGILDYKLNSFEPNPKSFSVLNSKFANNTKVNCYNVGLSDSETDSLLYLDSVTSGCATMEKPDFNNNFNQSVQIHLMMLDKFILQNEIKKIHLLKIDVEGHELSVLQGAQESLNKNLVRNIYFEFGFPAVNARVFLRDYFMLLTFHNYKLYRVTPTGTLFPICGYKYSLEQFRASSMYFASLDI